MPFLYPRVQPTGLVSPPSLRLPKLAPFALVLVAVAHLREVLVAALVAAFVRTFAGVRALVRLAVAPLREGLVAALVAALVRALSGVRALVLLE